MNGYNLSRKWFDFSFENHEAKVQHTAIYLWCVELNNRFGWKDNFRLPTNSTMEGLSIGNKNTFLSALKDLESWGFIKIISESKNQNQARIISICRSESEPAQGTALDMALIQQSDGTGNGTGNGTVPIDKQVNQETITKKIIDNGQDEIEVKKQKFTTPTVQEISEYLKSKHPSVSQDKVDAFATKFWSHYENKSWSYGRGQKMKDWRLAFGQWQETISKDLYQSGNTPTKPSPPRKSKVKYYDTDFPDRVRVATREEYNLLVSGNPDSTFVITQEYFD
jgi:hypothetical protein